VTHAAVSQVRSALQAESLIQTRPDPADGRRHVLTLTAAGTATAATLQPLWDAINAATASVLAEDAPALVGELAALTRALDRRPLSDRAMDLL
jgi:DNA-binding MarR family transcriptional regulator